MTAAVVALCALVPITVAALAVHFARTASTLDEWADGIDALGRAVHPKPR